jgi:mannose-6-phosphate isomerase-like protein (cupin superfamily)
MKVTTIDEGFLVMSDENMTGRRLYASREGAVIHIAVNPGKAIEPHAANVDMELFVLEGRGVFTVGDEAAELGPGCLVESPRDIPHGIQNPGPGTLRVLAIKNGDA